MVAAPVRGALGFGLALGWRLGESGRRCLGGWSVEHQLFKSFRPLKLRNASAAVIRKSFNGLW